jgi:hypothetical protein
MVVLTFLHISINNIVISNRIFSSYAPIIDNIVCPFTALGLISLRIGDRRLKRSLSLRFLVVLNSIKKDGVIDISSRTLCSLHSRQRTCIHVTYRLLRLYQIRCFIDLSIFNGGVIYLLTISLTRLII